MILRRLSFLSLFLVLSSHAQGSFEETLVQINEYAVGPSEALLRRVAIVNLAKSIFRHDSPRIHFSHDDSCHCNCNAWMTARWICSR